MSDVARKSFITDALDHGIDNEDSGIDLYRNPGDQLNPDPENYAATMDGYKLKPRQCSCGTLYTPAAIGQEECEDCMTSENGEHVNNLTDLNSHLFAQVERLSDKDLVNDKEKLRAEIFRAEALTGVAKTVIENANLVLKAHQIANGTSGIADPDKKPKVLQ